MNLMKSTRSDVLILLGGWVIFLLISWSFGNYPVNDDWAYAQIVRRLLRTGVYDLGFWPGMTLFTHIMWGSLFCKIFGFSFTVLRLSTLVMAMLGSVVFLRLIRALLGEDRWSRRIALGTFVFNPFFFLLSTSYMTDVPFLTLVLFALLYFKKSLEEDRNRDWGLMLFFSVAAILTRQLALILPLTFAGVLLLKYRSLKHLLVAGLIVTVSVFALYGYTAYMEATVGLPPPFGRPESLLQRLNVNFILGQIKHRGGIHLFYSSFFLIPFIATLDLSFSLRRRSDLLFLLLSVFLCSYLYAFSYHMIPIGNLFYGTGFGPVTLPDVERGFTAVDHLSRSAWSVIIGIAFLASVALLYYAGKKAWSVGQRWKHLDARQYWKLGILLILLGYSIFMLIDIHKFDRYFFPTYACLICLLASKRRSPMLPNFQKVISLGGLLLLAMYSIIATHDYHAWQGARWKALEDLIVADKIDPGRIDGGFEFNGWYETGPKNPGGKDRKSWWFVQEDEYAIAREEFNCYELIRKFPTHTWLGLLGDSLAVVKRPPLARRDTLDTDLETTDEAAQGVISNDGQYTFSIGGKLDTTVAFSGKQSVLLTPEHPYGLSLKLGGVQPCEQITMTVWRLGNSRSAGTVIRAPDVERLHSFERYFVDREEDGGWMRLRHELTMPDYNAPDTLHVYLWNPVADSIWMDDLQIIRRRNRSDR